MLKNKGSFCTFVWCQSQLEIKASALWISKCLPPPKLLLSLFARHFKKVYSYKNSNWTILITISFRKAMYFWHLNAFHSYIRLRKWSAGVKYAGTLLFLIILHQGLENWVCKKEFLYWDGSMVGSDPLEKDSSLLDLDLGNNCFCFPSKGCKWGDILSPHETQAMASLKASMPGWESEMGVH